jgi:Fe-S-cluster containining protein
MSATPQLVLSETHREWLMGVHDRARAAIRQVLSTHGRAPGLARAIARARVALLDRELAPLVDAMEKAKTPIDCRAGCSSCCTLKVEITPDEAFALMAELDDNLDAVALDDARARASENDRRGRDLPPKQRQLLRLFCPVLDRATGACRGHAGRPAPCQGCLALDRKCCEAASRGEEVPIVEPVASGLIRDAVMAAQVIVLEDAGFDQTRIELSAGLLAAWADPAAEQRWLGGHRAFPAPASV